MPGDEERIVRAFRAWLEATGWTIQPDPEFCGAYAVRGDERLFAIAIGGPTSVDSDIDTAYGRLLQQVRLGGSKYQLALAVPTSGVEAALRVDAVVRERLSLTVCEVTDDDEVHVISDDVSRTDGSGVAEVGVGPHPQPWPEDPRLDPNLLRAGDRRNVLDSYRYWTNEAIVADLDTRRHPFHVAVENWQHDLNIGTVVRNANAFLARAVHIVGNRRWNRRGAMVTDRYVDVRHHASLDELVKWARAEGLPIIGIDLLPGSRSILDAELPRECVLLFGQEGPGLSEAARAAITDVLHIPQYGSTRSINAGVASGIAMHEWLRRYGD